MNTTRPRPFHRPPIQRRRWPYRLAIKWVAPAAKRYYRLTGFDGKSGFPKDGTPAILVGNHQNGMMDPLVLCAMKPRNQFHWLTRSDIFYNRIVRTILFGLKMLPIYRLRDRLLDTKERNEEVMTICAKRLAIGAQVALYPEGNHNAQRTLRPFKPGVTNMLEIALRMDPTLERIQLIPVGLDYEDYAGFRRRLRCRLGPAIPFADLFDEATGKLDRVKVVHRIEKAMAKVMVNVPAESYGVFDPYVRAMRTTEIEAADWEAARSTIERFANFSEAQIARIEAAWTAFEATGCKARPEDLGMDEASARRGAWWVWPLAPLAGLGWLTTGLQAQFVVNQARKRVKDLVFRSTFRLGLGMALWPISWGIMAGVAGILGGAWVATGTLFACVFGSLLAGWWYGRWLDSNGALKARKAWANEKQSRAWSQYIETVKDEIEATDD